MSFDDEGTYVSQAWIFWTRGELSHYTYWYDHPPVGWIQLSAWTFLTHAIDRYETTVAAGREFLVVVKAVCLVLLYMLARRLELSRPASVLAVVLFALSPLALHLNRQVLLDNIAMPWVLAALVLAADPRRRLIAHASAGACLAVAVLSKETSLLFAPGVLALLLHQLRPPSKAFALALAASLFVLPVAFYVLFALLKGELFEGQGHVSLEYAIRWQLLEREGTGSMLDPDSLTRSVVEGWLRQDPWILAGGVLLAPAALFLRRLRSTAITVLLLAAMLLRSGYTPPIYVVGFLPFCPLIVAGVADRVAGWPFRDRSRRRSKVLMAIDALVLLVFAGGMVAVSLAWADGIRSAMTEDRDLPYREAASWLREHVDDDQDILLDNSLWSDIVLDGHPRDRAIWYYRLDLDPAVAESFPGGWQDFEYVISSAGVRSTLYSVPTVRAAVEHSSVVQTFGEGEARIEIRRVMPESRDR